LQNKGWNYSPGKSLEENKLLESKEQESFYGEETLIYTQTQQRQAIFSPVTQN